MPVHLNRYGADEATSQDEFMAICIDRRVRELRDVGYREVFWGVDGPGQLR